MDYPSNSDSVKNTNVDNKEKIIKPIVKGTIVEKKGIRKVVDTFLPSEITDIKSWFVYDVFIPSVKNLGLNIAQTIFGDGRKSNSKNSGGVSYWRSYDDPRNSRNYRGDNHTRRNISSMSYEDVTFDTRMDAIEMLSNMEAAIDRYSQISIGDFFDMAGLTPSSTDFNYGWKNLMTADVYLTGGRWSIRLPKAIPLK